MAALYGGFKVSFPKLSAGMIFLLFNHFSETKLIILTLIGQLLGTLLGSVIYSNLVCENESLQAKEIEVNENEGSINF